MADIFHYFPIKAPSEKVFEAISSASGLDAWWTKSSKGNPTLGIEYELWFGPEYDWRARVSKCEPGFEFEFEMIVSDKDWGGTRVGFTLIEKDGVTEVRFRHTGWPESNEHFRISSYCWAAYLRLLRRYIENGEVVPYEDRLYV